MVAWVVALWQGLVHVEGDDWPTNRKPLVAPKLKKERIAEKDQLRRTTFNTPEHRPLYVPARTELPQLIWGTTCKGASAILRVWGIRYLATASPCELQNGMNPNSRNRYASKNLSTVSNSVSSTW
jgi:hypothetical protein